MTINGLTIDNNAPTGIAIISDSLEIPIVVENLIEGLNDFVVYTKKHFEREIILEFRSSAQLTSFFSTITEANGGQVVYDGHTYYLKSIPTLVENYGETGGAWSGASWRYSLSLVRKA